MTTAVVDSWALIGWMQEEIPARDAFVELLERAENGDLRLCVSLINWGEVFYTRARRKGQDVARRDLIFLRQRIELLAVDEALVLQAALLKSGYQISYADGFAAACAMNLDAPLVTGDPELRRLAAAVPALRLHWVGRG